MTVDDADHGSYLGGDARREPTVVSAMAAFLDATVGGAPAAGLADLRAAGNRPGGSLEAGPE